MIFVRTRYRWSWDTGWIRQHLVIIITYLLAFGILILIFGQYLLIVYQTPDSADTRLLQNWRKRQLELQNVTRDIINTLEDQRDDITDEIFDLGLDEILFNSSVRDLTRLIPENGGQPLRSIIVTSWRSGSTFIGEVLNALPGNYYHYEPLLDYDIVQIRGPPLADEVFSRLKSLLSCHYFGLDRYLEYGQNHTWLFTHNDRLWEKCEEKPHLCWLPEFLSPFCKLFPFQSMKVVRVRLALFEQLLKDPKYNVKILYLVRDPRGTLQSRKHRDWCPESPDCWDPSLLCADLVSDYSSSVRFLKKYGDRFRAVRYEDVSSEPYSGIENVLKFFGFKMHPNVLQFLDTHTKTNYGGVSSTYRDSKSRPFNWRNNLTFEEVSYIQTLCKPAMELWGYIPAYSELHQKNFTPITSNFNIA